LRTLKRFQPFRHRPLRCVNYQLRTCGPELDVAPVGSAAPFGSLKLFPQLSSGGFGFAQRSLAAAQFSGRLPELAFSECLRLEPGLKISLFLSRSLVRGHLVAAILNPASGQRGFQRIQFGDFAAKLVHEPLSFEH
jgi:hypothetical protein